MENSNRIKDGNGRLVLEAAGVRRIWKEYKMRIYIIWVPRNRLQFTCVAFLEFGETTAEESRLGERSLIDDEEGGVQSREGVCRSNLHPKVDR